MSVRDARSKDLTPLLAVILAGAALRLYGLGAQSLWHDEAISLTVAGAALDRLPDFFRSIDGRLPIEYNPPVYAYVLHAWLGAIGFGDVQARLLSAAAGIAALPVIFILGRRLFGAAAGLAAAALLAVSQLGVMFSQEARHYELFLLLVLVTATLYWTAMTRRSFGAWCACTASAIVMVGTQYYGVFVVAALAVFTLIYWRSIPFSWVAGSAAAGAATLGPWLWFALAGQVSAASDRVQPEYFTVDLTTLIGTINRFNNGAVNGLLESGPLWTFAAGGVLFGGPLLALAWRAWRAREGDDGLRRATVFAALICGLPLAAVILLGAVFNVQFNIRYVAFCIGPYYLLAGAGLRGLPWPGLRRLAIAGVAVYSGWAVTANYRVPYKENYRDAIRFVAGDARPDDCYAFVTFGGPPLQWSIYGGPSADRRLTLAAGAPANVSCPRMWVITYQRVTTAAHARWRERVAEATAGQLEAVDRRWFWVQVERYDRADKTGGQDPPRGTDR